MAQDEDASTKRHQLRQLQSFPKHVKHGPRDPSIQIIFLHWALKSVNTTYIGLFGSQGSFNHEAPVSQQLNHDTAQTKTSPDP